MNDSRPAHEVEAGAERKTRWTYRFGKGVADGDATMRDLLGGKGANLAEMSRLGLPVPPGFTVSTEACRRFYAAGNKFPDGLESEVEEALAFVGETLGLGFGDPKNPLLVSVRSGARASMPGMMDTVLNLGLNDDTVEALSAQGHDLRFAYDTYRRFIQMYADVVLGVDHGTFESLLDEYKNLQGYEFDTELGVDDWKEIVEQFKQAVTEQLGEPFPQDAKQQLWGAIGAVFRSWNNARAVTYRRLHHVTHDMGTAVTVQAMVYGNMGETSATGVAFTRNPSTGEKMLYGEFLLNAQGEDVVAGTRTPQPMSENDDRAGRGKTDSLEALMPEAFAKFEEIAGRLEQHFRDMQDIEFTIQDGELFLLQTRAGKRTAKAGIRIAVDMANEGVISREDAVSRVDPASLDQLLHPTIDPDAERKVIAMGLPASPGAASGEIVFDADEAERLKGQGKKVILARVETSPEDIHGMHAAAGILTSRGGMTSHAAVVARGMGRPCVSGAGKIRIDVAAGALSVGKIVLKRGDMITIDGSTGEVIQGAVAMRQPELTDEFTTLMEWADAVSRLGVRANADTPRDARQARDFGAKGIGLCRTEHMFFEPNRILAVRQMILAEDEHSRKKALQKLLPMQRSDFVELFEIMQGRPITIRLLDPPLHEFLPNGDAEIRKLAETLGLSEDAVRRRIGALRELNPMLGHRGCRLSVTYPEITEMQAKALFEAVIETERKTGAAIVPEIMIPLVATRAEVQRVKAMVKTACDAVGHKVSYRLGVMIELPRACVRAGDIAAEVDFFSFGTNDLTQTALGISRDDATNFLPAYLSAGVLPNDPFVTLDVEGVGELIEIAVARGREAKPGLSIGICGEHGGDPASIAFFHRVGLDYVSCSPYRVPVARLAAAQIALGRAQERD